MDDEMIAEQAADTAPEAEATFNRALRADRFNGMRLIALHMAKPKQ